MDYLLAQDIENVMEITGLTMDDLGKELGVDRVTISSWINNKHEIYDKNLDRFYEYVFSKKIYLNKIKEQFYREDLVKDNEVLLFHGAKTQIKGELSLDYSKAINDFGKGFYCGKNLEQSAMFVAPYENSSLYMLKFDPSNLKSKKYSVNREWMLIIAYHRHRLNNYLNSEIVKDIIKVTNGIDYVIAPIADNRMFEIIDSFIDGEITDVQCQHCLSATNLGMQYVFMSEKALSQIKLLERCYLTKQEKEMYILSKQEFNKVNMDKVKLARKQYRNQGEYIEDILK